MSEPSGNAADNATSETAGSTLLSDEDLMRLVADRVWEMLKRDLRLERERAGFLQSSRELRGR